MWCDRPRAGLQWEVTHMSERSRIHRCACAWAVLPALAAFTLTRYRAIGVIAVALFVECFAAVPLHMSGLELADLLGRAVIVCAVVYMVSTMAALGHEISVKPRRTGTAGRCRGAAALLPRSPRPHPVGDRSAQRGRDQAGGPRPRACTRRDVPQRHQRCRAATGISRCPRRSRASPVCWRRPAAAARQRRSPRRCPRMCRMLSDGWSARR